MENKSDEINGEDPIKTNKAYTSFNNEEDNKDEVESLLDEIITDGIEEDKIDATEEPAGEEEEETKKTTEDLQDQVKPEEKTEEPTEEQNFNFDGINLADFISAELAIHYYQELTCSLLFGISKLMKKPVDKDKLRMSSDLEEVASSLLNVYWETIKIKINPVYGAAILVLGANIYNLMQAMAEEEDKKAAFHANNRKNKHDHDQNHDHEKTSNDKLDIEDIDFEEVYEKEKDNIIDLAQLQKQSKRVKDTTERKNFIKDFLAGKYTTADQWRKENPKKAA